jgi:pullulanase/glycogen debranching enzyme
MDANSFPDIAWFDANLNPPDWNDGELRTLAYQLDCREGSVDDGDRLLFLVFNASPNAVTMKIPRSHPGSHWRRVVDTSLPTGQDFADPGEEHVLEGAESYRVNGRTTVVLVAY